MDYWVPSSDIMFYAAKFVNRKVTPKKWLSHGLYFKIFKAVAGGEEAELLFSTLLLRTNHKSGRETMKQIKEGFIYLWV